MIRNYFHARKNSWILQIEWSMFHISIRLTYIYNIWWAYYIDPSVSYKDISLHYMHYPGILWNPWLWFKTVYTMTSCSLSILCKQVPRHDLNHNTVSNNVIDLVIVASWREKKQKKFVICSSDKMIHSQKKESLSE